ncbi:MAG: hypothetical protein KAT77_01200 [Nanoarchaeota archaeon]|nr:hypothetical protein [Nanoarchaeota archaeon]
MNLEQTLQLMEQNHTPKEIQRATELLPVLFTPKTLETNIEYFSPEDFQKLKKHDQKLFERYFDDDARGYTYNMWNHGLFDFIKEALGREAKPGVFLFQSPDLVTLIHELTHRDDINRQINTPSREETPYRERFAEIKAYATEILAYKYLNPASNKVNMINHFRKNNPGFNATDQELFDSINHVHENKGVLFPFSFWKFIERDEVTPQNVLKLRSKMISEYIQGLFRRNFNEGKCSQEDYESAQQIFKKGFDFCESPLNNAYEPPALIQKFQIPQVMEHMIQRGHCFVDSPDAPAELVVACDDDGNYLIGPADNGKLTFAFKDKSPSDFKVARFMMKGPYQGKSCILYQDNQDLIKNHSFSTQATIPFDVYLKRVEKFKN